MITEDYVSFEIARLLKKKGMDISCFNHYVQKNNNDGTSEAVTVCTLQIAMKWLRETKDWHIVLTPMFANDINRKMVLYGYDWEISSPSREQTEHSKDFLPNYEKSCEAAIKYCLENLI